MTILFQNEAADSLGSLRRRLASTKNHDEAPLTFFQPGFGASGAQAFSPSATSARVGGEL